MTTGIRGALKLGAWSLIAIGVASLSAQDAQPSFDCHHTTTVVERVICSHPELAALDVEMMRLFRELVTKAPASKRKDLYTEQARWIARRNECGDTDSDPVQRCIDSAYRQRIAQLRPAKK